MLSLWEIIKMRRSIREFAPDDVPDEMIQQMLEAARLAPSGINCQPWRFILVRDKEVKKKICRIRSDQKFIEEAPVVIVCFGDLEAISREARKKRVQELFDLGAKLSGRLADPKYWEERFSLPPAPHEEQVRHVILNTSIAIEHLLLMATALGLGTCWCGAIDVGELNRLFDLPDNLVSVAVIPVGHPAGEVPPQPPRLNFEEIVLKPRASYTGYRA
ncbi:nitroreductase family protein [Chloroflexota bacterium]